MTKTLEESGRHAFPSDRTGGMTLRDYFAAKAMQGYLANTNDGFDTIKESANFCYKWADAMLSEREK